MANGNKDNTKKILLIVIVAAFFLLGNGGGFGFLGTSTTEGVTNNDVSQGTTTTPVYTPSRFTVEDDRYYYKGEQVNITSIGTILDGLNPALKINVVDKFAYALAFQSLIDLVESKGFEYNIILEY